MVLKILLFITLFVLFYLLFGPIPKLDKSKDLIKKYGYSLIGIGVFFIFGKTVFMTALAGMFWAALGWFLPLWIIDWKKSCKRKNLKDMTKSFAVSASSLYSSGNTTPEVLQSCSEQFPEPLSSEFQNMLGMRNLYDKATYPKMFRGIAQRYDLTEFNAIGEITEAGEKSGGPKMIARSLRILNRGLRKRSQLIKERKKSNQEALLTSILAILILSLGLLIDVTVAREYFTNSTGKLILALSSGVVIGMVVTTVKAMSTKDIE
ncbi:MAG: hypothetical protein K9L17_08345 [Clostridiales bacterium]|nr:hypothetical protein [Clostridiales bacterium]MCF8022685.1 hypothetical protein [Clostridiales bacterium]